MDKNLTVFAYDEKVVRTVTDENGEIWFMGKDVAVALGYSDTQAMTRRLDEDEQKGYTDNSSGQGRQVTIINESGLYSSILGSNKEEAKQFKRWVTHEVLPSIRKSGGYAVNGAELERRVGVLENVVIKLEDMMVEVVDTVRQNHTDIIATQMNQLKIQGMQFELIREIRDQTLEKKDSKYPQLDTYQCAVVHEVLAKPEGVDKGEWHAFIAHKSGLSKAELGRWVKIYGWNQK